MSARFLPFERLRAVTFYFACLMGASFGLSLPVASRLSSGGVLEFPEGDRLLFEPGALFLSETLRTLYPELPAELASSLGLATLFAVLLLLPLGVLLSSLARPAADPLAAHWAAAAERFPALVAVTGLALAAQAVTAFGASLVARGLAETSGSVAALLGAGLGLLLCLAIGVIRDLARAAAVAGRLDARAALTAGSAAFLSRPQGCLSAWGPALLGQIALVGAAAALTSVLDVSRPGDGRVAAVFVIHQLALYGLVLIRAYWLGKAVLLVTDK